MNDVNEPTDGSTSINDPTSINDVDDPRMPDPDAAVVERGTAQPAEGRDETDADARSSLPPGSHTRSVGPKSDVDRAQPYDEQPMGLRMKEQPLRSAPAEETID